MLPHISTSKRSSRSALSRIDNVLEHPKRDPEQRAELSARSKEPMPGGARAVDPPQQDLALSVATAIGEQLDSDEPSYSVRLDIVKWLLVVTLFASAAFVMIVPFIRF